MSIVLDGTTGVTAPALTGPIDAANLTGVLPAIDGSALTGLTSTNPLTLGTAVASTSGTAIDFTGIPSWAKRITVMFSGVSSTGYSIVTIQLGSAGGIEASGYLGKVLRFAVNTWTYFGLTTAACVEASGTPEGGRDGTITITKINGNSWVFNSAITNSVYNYQTNFMQGSKTLSGTLDRIRISTVEGTDTFDAGTINISYEG